MLPISDAINTLNLQLPHTLPDHSVIISEFDLFSFISQSVPSCNDQSSGKKCKKNIRKNDGKFMCSTECIQLINCAIEKIEANVKCQTEIDYIYSNVKSIFVSEIDKLPEIQTASSKHGKRALRKAAPFWNPELQRLWQTRCDKENLYLSFQCDGKDRNQRNAKQILKDGFKQAQQIFDTKFRQFKRQHKYNSFHKLADLAEKAANDPSEMWKRLKALSDRKSSHVLLETIRADGSICKDKKEVLLKWYSDFSECFKGIKDDPDLVFDDDFLEEISKLKVDFDKLSVEE